MATGGRQNNSLINLQGLYLHVLSHAKLFQAACSWQHLAGQVANTRACPRSEPGKERTNGIINMAARRPPVKGATPEVDSPKSTIPTNTIPTSKPPAAATTTRKQPPVEKPSDIRRRTWVILSFWLIVVCLGLPIWWETTTIYRANLPLTEMLEWSDGKVWRHPL